MFETPEFKSQEEEANWWDSHKDYILQELEQAAKEGTLGHGTLARAGLTRTTTIRLDPKDIDLARSQAEQRGLKYQTYLKMIIHQALMEEAGKRR